MHILITVNSAWNVWNFRRAVTQALLKDGHTITVLAPPDDSVGQLRTLGCRFLPLEMNPKQLNPIEGLKLVHHFQQAFRSERPDIVLSYTIKNNLFGAVVAKSLRIPFLPNVTGLGTAFLSGGLLEKTAELFYRHAFRNLPMIFFQNKDDRDLFVSRRLVKPEQAQLLPGSGIDLQHFVPAPFPAKEDAPVFLMIARLLRDKGVIELVEAARQVKAQWPEVRFQLLGTTGSENRSAITAETVRAWVREGIVEYLGTTPDVRPNITSASCVILPSYREGTPRTLLEAAAMARPVIATDVAGCRAVVDHKKTGFLCRARDAGNLADSIGRFLELSSEQRTAMGRAARAKIEYEYNQKIVVRAYLRAIKKLTWQNVWDTQQFFSLMHQYSHNK